MTSPFPSADEYSSERAQHPALRVVDVRAEAAAVTESYRNQVLLDVDDECVRLAVFEGEYRWHRHPDSDELFVVVEGTLEIDLQDRTKLVLHAWQMAVVPAGVVHRTRALGRTVNLTCEKRSARTEFVDDPDADRASGATKPLRT
jgi:mannose-6-phosphate isomerase-like protein (cupin superfamily)